MAKNKNENKGTENLDADQLNGDEAENFSFDTEMPEGWGSEEVMTNYPPYWKGDVGEAFVATVVAYDEDLENDGAFPRYILRALRPVKGWRGGKDTATSCVVKPGEVFTCSVWTALDLTKLIGLDIYVKALPNIKANTPAGFVRAFRCVPSTQAMGVLKARQQKVIEGQLLEPAKSA